MTPRQRFDEALSHCRGERITQVTLRPYSCDLGTENNTFIRLDGNWELLRGPQEIVDREVDLPKRTTFELWRTCGAVIVEVIVAELPIPLLTIKLDNNYQLRAWAIRNEGWEIKTSLAAIFSDPDLQVVYFDGAN